jgi:hypothetical protein
MVKKAANRVPVGAADFGQFSQADLFARKVRSGYGGT